MLLLPITTRANFWATKFISFVVLEQLNIPNALRTMPIDGFAQSPGGAIECLVPSRRAQLAPVADQRLSQPGISPRSGLGFHRSLAGLLER